MSIQKKLSKSLKLVPFNVDFTCTALCRLVHIGTMLIVRTVEFVADGRSVVDTVGGKRFRVREDFLIVHVLFPGIILDLM